MKRNHIPYILVVMVIFMTGCERDELLDIEPYRLTIPSTVEEFRLLMDERSNIDGTYSKGRAPMYEIDLFMSDELKVPDGELDNFITFSGETRFANALTWEEDFCNPLEDDSDWATLYNQILISNVVLDAMSDPEITGDAQLRRQLESEAKVHRALAYFGLVNLYSKQYDPSTASTDIGVPLRLRPEPSGSLERSTVQEVYDLILNDLNEAIANGSLPAQPQTVRVRPSLASAYAILAKAHLAMGNYEEALQAAENSLENYGMLYNYNALPFLPQNFDNMEVLLLKERPTLFSFTSTLFVNDELIQSYGPSDLRLNYRFILDFFTNEYTFDRNRTMSVVGPTVPEMYLVRAECNARIGNLSFVNDDINTIRENRIFAPDYSPIGEFSDRGTALEAVKRERFLELPGMGVRLFDLKRYNIQDNANISLTKVINGTTFTLEPNSNRWIVPVSRNIIQLNPEIEQSPR